MKPRGGEATKPKTPTQKHPKVSEMVLLAIAILNERNGSSMQAIKKYIVNSFTVDERKISAHVKKYLRMAVASGTLVQTKGKGAAGSFRLGGSMKCRMSEILSRLDQHVEDSDDSSSSSSTQNASVSTKNPKKSKI